MKPFTVACHLSGAVKMNRICPICKRGIHSPWLLFDLVEGAHMPNLILPKERGDSKDYSGSPCRRYRR
jgi:hypothetical protein